MSKFRRVQTAFTTGELSDTLRGRRDTQLYYLGLEEGLNLLATPQGSAKVRPGTRFKRRLREAGSSGDMGIRLGAFVFSQSQAYVAHFAHVQANFTDVATNETQQVSTPFQGGALDRLDWVQVADTMLLVHPAYPGVWEIARTLVGSPSGSFPTPSTEPGVSPAGAPEVTTDAATAISGLTATLNGTLDSLSGEPSAQVAFQYRKVGVAPWSSSATDVLSGTGAFSVTLSGLSPNTAYEFRARGSNANGTSLGEIESFITTDAAWVAGAYSFERSPQYKYHGDRATTLAASGTSGSVTITAAGGTDNAVFAASDIGSIWSMAGVQMTITAVASATSATATILGTLPAATATLDWTEAASSAKRGGFLSIAYVNGRLILGGTFSAPFRLWASRVGAPFDFLEGGTDAADPFSLDVTTGRADPINYVVAGSGGIEIFTEGGEGFIPSGPDSPVTPATIAYVPQTSYGTRRVKPVRLDSQTIFAQRAGGAVREFVYSDVEQAYAAVPLTIRAQHLLSDPVRMAGVAGGFGLPVDFLLAVNADGTVACMTSLRSEEVTAWTPWQFARPARDICSVLSRVYVATEDSAGTQWLEEVDSSAIFDGQFDATSISGTSEWGPFSSLTGVSVSVFADGFWRGGFTVDDAGMLSLDDDYFAINVGLPFEVRLRPMPPESEDQSLLGMPIRPYKVELSYRGSAALRVNGRVVPDRSFDNVIETAPEVATNVRRVRLRGWKTGKTQAPVITRDGPFPFEVLAMAVDYRIGTG